MIIQTHRVLRAAAILAASLGFFTNFAAGLAAYWVAVGDTPAWVYSRFGSMGFIATPQRAWGIPAGFVVATLFGLILWTWLRNGRNAEVQLRSFFTFVVAVLITGTQAFAAWVYGSLCWTPAISTWLGVVLICAAALEPFPSLGALTRHGRATLGRIVQHPPKRTVLLAGLCVIALAVTGVRAKVERVSPEMARDRVFKRWYEAQTPFRDPRLRTTTGVKIVVFSDHQCQFCATAIPNAEATIEQLNKETSRNIVFEVRDFPIDSECNPAFDQPFHAAGCESAAAVRLVNQRLGIEAGREVSNAFLQQHSKLTLELIRGRLEKLQLAEEFSREYSALLQQVSEDVALGRQLGVTGTPAFFVDGVKLRSAASLVNTALRYVTRGTFLPDKPGAS